MKIEQSKITKIKLTELERLDSVSVYLEDIGTRSGEVTIKCYDKSWTAYWGGCGDEGVGKFFLSCNDSYIVNCLDRGISSVVDDYDNLDKWLKKHIIEQRKDRDISKDEAAIFWNDVNYRCQNEESWLRTDSGQELCQSIVGDEWWYVLPKCQNGQYNYLERIVQAVRAALEEIYAKADSK